MKVPIISLYSISLSTIALAYLIPSLFKIISKPKSRNTSKYVSSSIDRQLVYQNDIKKNKFGIKILKILKGTNQFKIFFVNTGEKLFKPTCESPGALQTILEIETADVDIDNNESGAILITGNYNDKTEVELWFEYQTQNEIYKKKSIRINVETKLIDYLE